MTATAMPTWYESDDDDDVADVDDDSCPPAAAVLTELVEVVCTLKARVVDAAADVDAPPAVGEVLTDLVIDLVGDPLRVVPNDGLRELDTEAGLRDTDFETGVEGVAAFDGVALGDICRKRACHAEMSTCSRASGTTPGSRDDTTKQDGDSLTRQCSVRSGWPPRRQRGESVGIWATHGAQGMWGSNSISSQPGTLSLTRVTL